MNKKIICLFVSADLLLLASPVLAVSIPNYGPSSFCALLTGISTAVAGLVGSIGTIMIILSGIFFLTSAGSPERTGLAKKTLIYAVAGIIIALAAGAIISIVKTAIGASGGSC